MDKDKLIKEVERLNEALELNRVAFERITPLATQINMELEDNKKKKIQIEAELDMLYFQIRQSQLS